MRAECNLLKLCRVCGRENENSINMFERMHKQLVSQIEDLIGEKLKRHKYLPKRLCSTCHSQLNAAHTFRKLCLDSQQYFDTDKFKEQTQSSKCIDEMAGMSSDMPQTETLEDLVAYHNESILNLLGETPRRPLNSERVVGVDDSVATTNTHTHKKPAATEVPIICEQCGMAFKCHSQFVYHRKRHMGEKSFHCEICPNKYFTHSELKRHVLRHTGEKPLPCRYCNRRFTDSSTRIRHERTHTNERPFKCVHCVKAFTTSYVLKNHLLTHTGEREFKCKICNKYFLRHTHLVLHRRSMMHQQNEENYLKTARDEKT